MDINQCQPRDNQPATFFGIEISFNGAGVVSFGIPGKSVFHLLIDELGYGEADIPVGAEEARMIEATLDKPLSEINAALTEAARGRFKRLSISSD